MGRPEAMFIAGWFQRPSEIDLVIPVEEMEEWLRGLEEKKITPENLGKFIEDKFGGKTGWVPAFLTGMVFSSLIFPDELIEDMESLPDQTTLLGSFLEACDKQGKLSGITPSEIYRIRQLLSRDTLNLLKKISEEE